MKQQLVGVGDILYVEQFHGRVLARRVVLVHVLQHVFDAYLLAVANRPHAVELQSLDHGALQDEHRCGSRTADEIDTMRIEVGDGLGEHRMVVAGEQTDAVRADECGSVAFAGV